jgi:hypothetical protein
LSRSKSIFDVAGRPSATIDLLAHGNTTVFGATDLVQVLVPNLEKKSKSGRYFEKSSGGDGGFRGLRLSDCRLAW